AGLSCMNCPDPVASPNVTTQYKVTGSDTYGCSASDIITVKVVARPSALKIEAKNDICAGETIEIRASGAEQYQWSSTGSLPKSSGAVISVAPMVSTLYKVIAKDNNGNITDTGSIYITVRALPVVNAGSDAEITQGGSVQLKASGAEKYTWENTAGLSCMNCPDPVASPSVTTQYKVTGTNAYGCNSSDVVTVRVTNKQMSLQIDAKKDICEGETVTLRASGADQYLWSSTGNLQPTSGAMITVKPTVSTLYKVVAKSNSGSITDTASVYITVHAAPKVNAGADMAICKGEVQRLQASGAAKYTWSGSPALSCTSCEGPMAAPVATTSFIVTGYTDYGCSAKDSVLVTVRQPIKLTVDPVDDICIGKTVTLSARGADAYSWAPSAGINNPTSPVTTVSPKVTTQYTVVGKDAAGCFADTANVKVTVWTVPTVEAGEVQTLTAGQTIKLKPTYSKDVTTYRWSNAQTLNCADCPFPEAAPKNETIYRVEVANNGGCKAQDEVTIRVICSNGNLFIPNTFSPNQDGRNDNFYPRGNGIGRIKSLKIYNRSGDLVFSNENFQANNPAAGWDGRYKGQQLPADVFLYTCEVVCSNNEVLTY
ncbi:MAG: gliding motility-associated C-terminal domain-containing protein, partial [Sphingobacteriales bacterium]